MAFAHLHLAEFDLQFGRLDGLAGQEAENRLELRDRFVVRTGALCLHGCQAAVGHTSLQPSDGRSGAEVPGQLGIDRSPVRFIDLFERLGDPQMEGRLHRRRHHLDDRVANEGMHELVRQQMTPDADEEAAVDQFVEPGTDLVGRHSGGGRQHSGFDTLTGDRGELERPAGPA